MFIIFEERGVWERVGSKLVSEVKAGWATVQCSEATTHPVQSNQLILPEQFAVSWDHRLLRLQRHLAWIPIGNVLASASNVA